MTLPTPVEIADELKNNGFSDDQANLIAAEVYQPLKDRLNRLETAIKVLARSSDISKSISDGVHDVLNGEEHF